MPAGSHCPARPPTDGRRAPCQRDLGGRGRWRGSSGWVTPSVALVAPLPRPWRQPARCVWFAGGVGRARSGTLRPADGVAGPLETLVGHADLLGGHVFTILERAPRGYPVLPPTLQGYRNLTFPKHDVRPLRLWNSSAVRDVPSVSLRSRAVPRPAATRRTSPCHAHLCPMRPDRATGGGAQESVRLF